MLIFTTTYAIIEYEMKIKISLQKNNCYKHGYMKYVMLIIFLLHVNLLVSQSQQLELKISNDKIVFIDRYYTNGIHLTYRKQLEQDFLFSKQDHNNLQLNVTLGNETYTPKNLTSFNNQDFDRPYAGWLFFNIEIGNIKQKSAFYVSIDTGITGKESLAGHLQTKFHELLKIESMPTWVDQIAFKWLFNAKILQVQEFNINKNNSVQNHFKASLGNKDTFVTNDVYYFIGKFNNFQDSSRIDQISSKASAEVYGYVAAGYKYLILNSLIQGSPFTNNDSFTAIATNHVFNISSGFVVNIKSNIFKLVYNYNTKETPLSRSHSYGALTYGFSF